MNQPKQSQQSALCVDDDRELRELLHELIGQMGHTSETAVDGVNALEKMEKKHFDIVITDINMPRLDGIGLIKRIAADFSDIQLHRHYCPWC